MPKVPERRLSRGEVYSKKHLKPVKVYAFKADHVRDTARAWGIPTRKVRQLFDWVEENVPPHQRSRALTGLLRRYSA